MFFYQIYAHKYRKVIVMKRVSGFTLVELMIVIAVAAIIVMFAVPGVLGWMPNYRLKGAANDLYSNLQWAKLNAVKENKEWAVVFDTANGQYHICSDPGADNLWATVSGAGAANTVERSFDFSRYSNEIGYGPGSAVTNATSGGGALPGDNVSYQCTLCAPNETNVLVFNSRGTCEAGYVYLDNDNNSIAYAVGTGVSGIIRLRRWDGSSWSS